MARAWLVLVLLVSTAVVVLGCSSNDLVGSWTGNAMLVQNTDKEIDMAMTFDSDGSFTLSTSGQCLSEDTTCDAEFSGTYSYNDTSSELTFSLTCDSDTLADCCQCPSVGEDSVLISWSTCDTISTVLYHGYDVFLNKDVDQTGVKRATIFMIACIVFAIVMVSAALLLEFVRRRKKKRATAYDAFPEPSETVTVQ